MIMTAKTIYRLILSRLKLLALLDRYIPNYIKKDFDTLSRARVLVGILLANMLILLITIILMNIFRMVPDFNIMVGNIWILSTMMLYLFSIYFILQEIFY